MQVAADLLASASNSMHDGDAPPPALAQAGQTDVPTESGFMTDTLVR